MAQRFLYETIEVLEQTGFLQDMPVFIEKGLSSRIALRDYQKRAFQYFVTYYENLRKNKQVHTLFHMATGSGKTIIMAGLMSCPHSAKRLRRYSLMMRAAKVRFHGSKLLLKFWKSFV